MTKSSGTARLLLIDNYDSFTYNLVQAFLVLGADVHVYRNDAITVAEALAFASLHFAGPRYALRRRRIHGHDSSVCRTIAGTRRLSRAPVHRGGVRRKGRARRKAHARQDFHYSTRRAHIIRGIAAAVRGGSLSLPDCGAGEFAAGVGGERADGGGRDHGGAPSHAHGRGCAIPS